jgi:hypothetical protein
MIAKCDVLKNGNVVPYVGVALTGPDAPDVRDPLVWLLGERVGADTGCTLVFRKGTPEHGLMDLLRRGYTVRLEDLPLCGEG